MSVAANKLVILAALVSACLSYGAHAQGRVASETPPPRVAVQAPQVAPVMAAREVQARESIAGQDLLLALSSRVHESNRRLQATEDRLSAQMSKTTWLVLGGLTCMFLFAAMTGAAGFQYARHLAAKKERDLVEAGKEPLSVLIHATRDHATRLAQRLSMAGAKETRLFEGLMAALPALQVEAGKATFSLSRQIPKSEQPYLEGPVAPLDRIQRAERAAPAAVPIDGRRSQPRAADVGVAAVGRARAAG